MGKVYKIKDDTDINEFGKMGYDIIACQDGTYELIKVIHQPIDGDLVKQYLDNYYNNPKWIEEIYKKNKKVVSKRLGLKYDKESGKAIISKTFYDILTAWRIQINPKEDGWIGFASMDPFDRKVYYGKGVLDKYCPAEIDILKNKELIEVIEVEE